MLMQTPLDLVPTDWMSWEQKVSLKQFVNNVMEENAYTPDLPELLQYKTQYLFTYGSLKRGFCRSYVLKGCEAVGSGFTLDDEYIMYSTVGQKNGFPIIFPHTGDARGVIHGELYSIPSDLMPYLDFMEGNGNIYQRELIPVSIRPRGSDVYEQVNAWCYIGVPKSWEKYMNHKRIQLCDRMSPRSHAPDDYYIYMKKYEKEMEGEAAA